MKGVKVKKGFSLVELIIALSILIIMTGVAVLFLGDILYKAKVAKAVTDMEILIEALVLNDTENPTNKIDSGLVGSEAGSTIGAASYPLGKRDTLANLVGTYLLSLPNDPWGGNYEVNSYAGWIKSFGEDMAIAGTVKYDKDITTYFLPKNLFLSKIRAEDLDSNAILGTGDEIRLYFSKAVRCNLTTAVTDVETITGNFLLDGSVDGVASSAELGSGDISGVTTGFWDMKDLWAIAPGNITADNVLQDDIDAGGVGTDWVRHAAAHDQPSSATGNKKYNMFMRPDDYVNYVSAFTNELVAYLSCGGASYGIGSGGGIPLDIGYDVYIPTVNGMDYSHAYSIWESTKGYASYKTTAEKAKIYLKNQTVTEASRTLAWKSITD